MINEYCRTDFGQVYDFLALRPSGLEDYIGPWMGYIGVMLGVQRWKLPKPKTTPDSKSQRVEYVRWTPHPVIVSLRDNQDYIRVLVYS